MKKIIIILITLSLSIFLSPEVHATYNYSFWDTIDSAEAMSVLRVIDNSNLIDTNQNLNTITLGDLKDSFIYENKLFVSDSKNNKVYVFNEMFEYVTSYPNEANPENKLNNPQGIHVFNNKLYVADYGNERIAIFDLDTKDLVQEVKTPNDVTFETLKFNPLKVVVDRTGRMNVVAFDVFEGVMEFDVDGNFNRYFGTNKITMNFLDALIYKFSTKEQRDKMALKIQTSFTSIDIDPEGYIYTVSRLEPTAPIKKLNFKGTNILQENGYVKVVGDATYQETDERTQVGPSTIIDVTVNENNQMYTILDNKRGKLFTYDQEGHLLYIAGQLGQEQNKLSGPTSVTYWNDLLIVTDNVSSSIIIYEPTQFGKLVNKAINEYTKMDYNSAKTTWEQVLKLNSNYFLAYAGIGRAEIRQGDYKSAMENLELGYDYYNYSKAYEQYRNQKLAVVLPYVLVGVFILAGYGIVKSVKKSIKRDEN